MMYYFFANCLIAIWAFGGWYLAGLGPAFILLPNHHKKSTFLLAPLVGMCLITLMSLFQITMLLTPLIPRFNVGMLIILTCIICYKYRKTLSSTWKKTYPQLCWFLIIPTILVLTFAWLFHNHGLHTLVGGSDQLQYSQNARQIHDVMHTHTAQDIPIPRQNYFVHDMITRTQPYFKAYRRGSETLLATTAAITHLTLEEAFPLTILNALMTLSLALIFIGRFFVLSRRSSLVLQITFMSSFYFLLLHIQGSLALTLSIAPGFIALTLLFCVARSSSLYWLPLTAIVVSSYLSIYAEPAIITILFPTVLLITWQFYNSLYKGFSALKRMLLLYLFILILSPFALYSLIANIIINLLQTYQQSTAISLISKSSAKIISLSTPPPIWAFSAVALGSMSYYDTSAINTHIAQYVANMPWVSWSVFLILGALALLGFLKKSKPLAYLFAITLILWMSICIILSNQDDVLRSTRAMEYAIPFILLGLVLLASKSRFTHNDKKNNFWIVTTYFSKMLITLFIVMNLYTSIRTISFITSHNINNDPTLLRFNEKWEEWHSLKQELIYSASHNNPVLISGFKETVRPLAISIAIRDQPHFLGTTILSFWPIYKAFSHGNWPYVFRDYSSYNTRFTKTEFQTAQERESKPWTEIESYLIQRSRQAVIPVGGSFPEEWNTSHDVFAFKVRHFPNIGDVIYRNEFDVTLSRAMVSSVMKDKNGIYRKVLSSGPILINEQNPAPHQLSLEYDGNRNDVKLVVGNKLYSGLSIGNGKIKITAMIDSSNRNKLRLHVTKNVKLRSITWDGAVS